MNINKYKRGFGVVLYEMTTLKRLFNGKSSYQTQSEILNFKSDNLKQLAQNASKQFLHLMEKWVEYNIHENTTIYTILARS